MDSISWTKSDNSLTSCCVLLDEFDGGREIVSIRNKAVRGTTSGPKEMNKRRNQVRGELRDFRVRISPSISRVVKCRDRIWQNRIWWETYHKTILRTMKWE